MNFPKTKLRNTELASALENPSAYSNAFFSVDGSDIQARLQNSPEERPYLVGDFLPQGIAGLLTGPGAVGKTTLAMQLGAAVATGTDFLGQPCEKGSVLMYLSEDDDCEITNRLHRIRQTLDDNTYSDLVSNLKVLPSPLVHLPMFDYEPSTRQPGATKHFANLWAAAHQLEDLRLIVIDSYTRINDLDEVNHSNASHVVLCLEMLARDTGATVVMIHHPPKYGNEDPRGSSALLNALRWTASLSYPRKGSQQTGGLRLSVAKHNYGPTVAYNLRRRNNGLLYVAEPEAEETEQDRNARVIDDICRFIEKSSDKEGYVIYSQLKDLAGLKKRFRVRQAGLKNLLGEACRQGKLIFDEKKGYKLPPATVSSAPAPRPEASNYEAI